MNSCNSVPVFGYNLSPYCLDLELEVKSEVESEEEVERNNSLTDRSVLLNEPLVDEPHVEIIGEEEAAEVPSDPLAAEVGQDNISNPMDLSQPVGTDASRKENLVDSIKSVTKALREVKRLPRERKISRCNIFQKAEVNKTNHNTEHTSELSCEEIRLKRVDHPQLKSDLPDKILRSSHVVKNRSTIENSFELEKEFECADCGRKFPKKSHLATHQRAHIDERKFNCNRCGSRFKTQANLHFHAATHSDTPFTCHSCEKTFPIRRMLKRHIRVVHRTERFKCDQCDRCFKSSGNLALHYTLHTGAKPHSCRPCAKSFVHKSTYKAHLRAHYQRECSTCLAPEVTGDSPAIAQEGGVENSSYLAKEGDLRTCSHRSVLPPRPWLCTVCGKAYPHKGTLKNHMKIHEPEKPYKCKQCPKSFMKKLSYECHMKQHRGERPEFMCDQCSVAYFSAFALKRHYTKHTGTRSFKCSTCPKVFWTKDALRVHDRTHTHVKAFACTLCHRAFAHKHSLAAHMLTHSAQEEAKQYECPTCSKTFVHKYNLTRHQRQHGNSQPL